MESGGGGEAAVAETLEFTPTWVVAVVCTIIVAVSLLVERCIHYTGKYLDEKKQKPLYEALQKIKEELMLLGFISLLLTVLQDAIAKICIPSHIARHMLPCNYSDIYHQSKKPPSSSTTSHYQTSLDAFGGVVRRLLAEGSSSNYCTRKNKVPLLSLKALHHLHIFIFVLAIVHVVFSALTIVFGGAKIRQWKLWEDSIAKNNYDTEQTLKKKVTHVRKHAFIRDHFFGIGKKTALLGWVHSFFKQFTVSVTETDYTTLRLGFIRTHCKGNPQFNFHKYMTRVLEDDFRTVVGISWYLWIFVVIFLLLNVNGWQTYFWIAFIPFILLLAVGTKLEHVMSQLAHEVAEKHIALEGDLVVQPSDSHFWFGEPHYVLFLIHFILFQNAFEIAFFFWIWVQYGFDSCVMGEIHYIVPRLIIGVFIQVLCSYSTLPLYALVTQMGSHYKKLIFDERVQAGLINWASKVRGKELKPISSGSGSGSGQGSSNDGASVRIELGKFMHDESIPEEIQPAANSEEPK